MTGPEEGFLLLCSHLGKPDRPILTGPQLRRLANRVRQASKEVADRSLTRMDLVRLGCSLQEAERIDTLLSDEKLLHQYLKAAENAHCVPLTWANRAYPRIVKDRLGADSPGCIWAKGPMELLEKPAIAVVGSREPKPDACGFAEAAGKEIARQGYVLVSGNARGVDSIAQQACLANGGSVISVVADQLYNKTAHDRLLYLSEDSFELAFTPARALSRNRLIHCLAQKTLSVQCREGKGGTWNGSVNNLKKQWSPLFCFDDGSAGAAALERLGAHLIGIEALESLELLCPDQGSLF